MTTEVLKNKINKSLDEMDDKHLKHAYTILKEIANQKKYADIKVDKNLIDSKIDKGIAQLDKEEGTDFRLFLNEMQAAYGNKK